MKETKMGNRGSKSKYSTNFFSCAKARAQSLNRIFVKEQRVDGSCFGLSPKLRCILMGGASYYPINFPSKQFKFYFSTLLLLLRKSKSNLIKMFN
jgi:hypothetical protein